MVATTPDRDFFSVHAPGAELMPLADFEGKKGESLIKHAKAIVYLASRSVPVSFLAEPWLEISENVQPAFRVFARISEINSRVKIVLLSSGGAVYGLRASHNIVETDPLAPISPYGLGKVMVERALEYLGDTRSQRQAILRISNPIGRWHNNPKQGLVMAILRALKSGEKMAVYGEGTQIRDYLDADDLADGILKVALTREHERGIWNVGSGQGFTILEIIDVVSSLVGRRPEISFLQERPCDVKCVVLDASRFRRDFGWAATTLVEESIRKTIDSGVLA